MIPMLRGMIEWFENLVTWIRAHPQVLWWSGAASLMMFFGTVVVVPLLLVKMRSDYFIKPLGGEWRMEHPVLRWLGLIGKNLLGVVLVVLGIALLVLPGQGLLTILLGMTLLDVPGKRRLEIALLRQRGVHRAVNWLRARYDRPPLQMPAR